MFTTNLRNCLAHTSIAMGQPTYPRVSANQFNIESRDTKWSGVREGDGYA
jgi:hypothetical protein